MTRTKLQVMQMDLAGTQESHLLISEVQEPGVVDQKRYWLIWTTIELQQSFALLWPHNTLSLHIYICTLKLMSEIGSKMYKMNIQPNPWDQTKPNVAINATHLLTNQQI